jgi:gamma-glutamylcysteine synthetase
VWFDYPDPRKTGCISQEVLRRLQSKDSKERPAFDWKFTYSKYKTCVRLSEHGYGNKDDVFFT